MYNNNKNGNDKHNSSTSNNNKYNNSISDNDQTNNNSGRCVDNATGIVIMVVALVVKKITLDRHESSPYGWILSFLTYMINLT